MHELVQPEQCRSSSHQEHHSAKPHDRDSACFESLLRQHLRLKKNSGSPEEGEQQWPAVSYVRSWFELPFRDVPPLQQLKEAHDPERRQHEQADAQYQLTENLESSRHASFPLGLTTAEMTTV
jgi:hypothetical protein